MTEPEHSPLPWHVVANDTLLDAKEKRVCECYCGSFLMDEHNARLIVRAVNSHAELLAAAKEVRHINLNLTRLDNDFGEKLSQLEHILYTAIARAEEPAP